MLLSTFFRRSTFLRSLALSSSFARPRPLWSPLSAFSFTLLLLLLLLLCGEIRECFWGFFVDESTNETTVKAGRKRRAFFKEIIKFNSLLGRRRPFFCLSGRKGTERKQNNFLRLRLRWMTTTTGMRWLMRRWRKRMRLLTKGNRRPGRDRPPPSSEQHNNALSSS